MLLEPHIGLKPLAALCRRLAISLSAGVDVRTVWTREVGSAHGPGKRRFEEIREGVARGTQISEAMKGTGNYFPEFFREMVQVGEQTGHLPEVFRQLSEHYELQLQRRRALFSSLTWPLIELTLALSVIGLVIYLMGAIPSLAKSKTDILGFGLTGSSGLITYLMIVGAAVFGLGVLYRATTRGVLWVAPLQKAVMRIPKLGRALETLAISRMAWAMYVTLNSGMNLRDALKMSLRSTQNVIYTQHTDGVLRSIRQGNEIHEALSATGAFPIDFLDAVQVGEDSGQLVESMQHLSAQYQDEARLAMNTLTVLLGMLIMAIIAGFIIFMIFRIFGFYAGVLNDAANMKAR